MPSAETFPTVPPGDRWNDLMARRIQCRSGMSLAA